MFKNKIKQIAYSLVAVEYFFKCRFHFQIEINESMSLFFRSIQ